MSSITVRVRPHTYQILQDLAKERGESLPDALDHLVEELRRWRILQQANEAYAAMVADPEAEAAWNAELSAWDVTLADGMDQYPDAPGDW